MKTRPKSGHQPIKGIPHWVIVALVSALFGAFFGALFSVPGPMLYKAWFENHPDTIIHQLVAEDGPWVVVENRGEAADRVRIEIRLILADDSIVGVSVSEPASVKLIRGGLGESYATFAIDELWPHVSQFIYIRTSSNTKIGADVKGYSLPKGRSIEETIPVIRAQ